MLGELGKLVSASPQRILRFEPDCKTGTLDPAAQIATLSAQVIGSPGESVVLTFVAPPVPGTAANGRAEEDVRAAVVTTALVLPSSGAAWVDCSSSKCAVRGADI